MAKAKPSSVNGIDYREWIGGEITEEDTVSLAPVRRLLATLDDRETHLATGDPLPPLWHWLFFLPDALQADLGADGHPPRGGFLPPIGLARRMWAGGSLRFHQPVPIGATLRRLSRVSDISEKEGRSGPLIFATIAYQFFDGADLCIEERQDIVYRDLGPPLAATKPLSSLPTPPAGSWTKEIAPDPRLLFRYSALTFNAHRIHYDRLYTKETEGYPGLIVHGPLVATLLLDLIRRNSTGRVAQFDYRAKAPLFDTHPFRVTATPDENQGLTLAALRCDGEIAMSGTALLD